MTKVNEKYKEQQQLQDEISNNENYIDSNVISVLHLLEEYGFVNRMHDKTYELTVKGTLATQFREVHCVLFTELIINNKLDDLNTADLASFLSCFTNISVPEDLKALTPYSTNKKVESLLINVIESNNKLEEKENSQKIIMDTKLDIQFDTISYIYEWCECENINDCKLLLQKMQNEKEIFLGEFIKSILKINNIVNELEKVAEKMGNIKLLQIIKEIPQKILKYVATNQSLYI